ncbi:MAG: aminotransferase class V-fold PLP-dependent enzyme, partial [Pseudomonadales bacterium]|nr:aminotransferase class V-fold PLP-dependent enzyme [Pseudomonadales bacterium]
MIDLTAVRRDCPACENLVHFNNAGSALSPDSVTDAVISHLKLEQQIGGYEAAASEAKQLSRFYTAFAELFNCDAGEIAYQENATRAWHAAFHAIDLQPGDHVITGDMEYASNYLDLIHLARVLQLEVSVVPSDSQGLIDLDALKNTITPRTKLITLTHIASQRGDIQPASEVGQIAREHGLYYLLDACQSAGQLDLDVKKLQCDFLSGTGRKYLRGPRGTGFLYARSEIMDQLRPAVIDLHSAIWNSADEYTLQPGATRFENW